VSRRRRRRTASAAMAGTGSHTRVPPSATRTVTGLHDGRPCGPGSTAVAATARRIRVAPGPTTTSRLGRSPPTGPPAPGGERDPGRSRPRREPARRGFRTHGAAPRCASVGRRRHRRRDGAAGLGILVLRGCPGCQQGQGVLRRRPGPGGADDGGQPRLRRELHHLVGDVDATDHRVLVLFTPRSSAHPSGPRIRSGRSATPPGCLGSRRSRPACRCPSRGTSRRSGGPCLGALSPKVHWVTSRPAPSVGRASTGAQTTDRPSDGAGRSSDERRPGRSRHRDHPVHRR
jgi:hypothetical protein